MHGWLRLVAVGLCFGAVGCGERSVKDDGKCREPKGRAFTEEPLLSSCDELRTNESAVMPSGKVEHNIHRQVFCCR